ncbi:hypothetical protein C0Q70_05314 [Pomacea canaliculata]|uniref:Ephrin RBD domain-containing protein n=2 Tax=Pomacea canaliculata TaxID=400727 RepID=A0A2T7PKX7_POMCA|nr:hypothetical protein C0Q70_05314 [Pomacea canaliculata]
MRRGDYAWRVGRVAWVLQYLALLLPFAMSMLSGVDSGIRLPPVYWNSSNTMFQGSNNDNIIEAHIGDSIEIYCPHYKDDSGAWEYYIVYMVDQLNYETCVINNTQQKFKILNCSKPNSTEPHYYTLWILDFQSIPGNPDFKEGESYFFISTSGGQKSNIDNQFEGMCKTHNMRMILQVKPKDDVGVTSQPATLQSSKRSTQRTSTAAAVNTTSAASSTVATTTIQSTISTTRVTDKPPPEQSVATNDGFPADNVIHVGVDRKNEGTITDSGSFSATFCASASLWTSLTLWTICIVLLL